MPGDCDAYNAAWTAGYKAESVVRGSQGKAFWSWKLFSARRQKEVANLLLSLYIFRKLNNHVNHRYLWSVSVKLRTSSNELFANNELTTLVLVYTKTEKTRMWANAQRDGRPAKYRWRPLFNAAKFGWRPLLECRAVTLRRRESRWNL